MAAVLGGGRIFGGCSVVDGNAPRHEGKCCLGVLCLSVSMCLANAYDVCVQALSH